MKILVIEDDPTVGQYVKRGLEEQRYHVDLVADGIEGAPARVGRPLRPDRARPAAAGEERASRCCATLRAAASSIPCWCSRRRTRWTPRSRRSAPAPTTTSPSRSRSRSCSRASRRWRAGPSARVPGARGRRPRARHRHARGAARRRAIELTPKEYTVLEYLMRHAGPGHEPHADHRVRLGLSLRSRHQHRGRRDQPAAQEGRRRARPEAASTPCAASGYVVKGLTMTHHSRAAHRRLRGRPLADDRSPSAARCTTSGGSPALAELDARLAARGAICAAAVAAWNRTGVARAAGARPGSSAVARPGDRARTSRAFRDYLIVVDTAGQRHLPVAASPAALPVARLRSSSRRRC